VTTGLKTRQNHRLKTRHAKHRA